MTGRLVIEAVADAPDNEVVALASMIRASIFIISFMISPSCNVRASACFASVTSARGADLTASVAALTASELPVSAAFSCGNLAFTIGTSIAVASFSFAAAAFVFLVVVVVFVFVTFSNVDVAALLAARFLAGVALATTGSLVLTSTSAIGIFRGRPRFFGAGVASRRVSAAMGFGSEAAFGVALRARGFAVVVVDEDIVGNSVDGVVKSRLM